MSRYRAIALTLVLGIGLLVLHGANAQDNGKWSNLKGQIVYGPATLPELEKLNVEKDVDHCLSKGNLFAEKWVINKKNKGVQNVFIWLEPDGNGPLPVHPKLKDAKLKDAVMDQPCCMFVPHSLALREGQNLIVKNSSPIPHNFKWGGHPLTNPGNNRLMPPGNTFNINNLVACKAPVIVECNIHPWMRAWIRVFDHPYYAVTDENGQFELPLAPAGNYRLKVWHPGTGWLGGAAGKKGQPINIKDKGDTDLGKLTISEN